MAIDILVVEDEYTERQELTQLLETVTPPEHIRSAATCSAAIAAISQLCPDLILLDIMLRGSSGFEVAEFVRSNRLDCKIIILTAYHEFDFASKALSMDLQDYLLKPVRPSVLLQRVRDVLHLSSPASAATGLAVWPYLACGISSPLPPIPNLLPNMTVVGILRDGTDREVISQINLALHGTGWTEQDGRRVIGYCRTAPRQSPEEAAEPLVAALTAIQLRFREPLKLETVAKEQYVNAAYLGRIFRAQTGQSFRDALTEERMRRAERLLRQQVSVSDTAVAVGYSDSNYFSRAYKKYFGHSPSESGPLRTH